MGGVSVMQKIVLASHGNLSKGMKNSLEMIVGNLASNITTYSLLPGGSATDFSNELAKVIQSSPDDQYIIIVDLFGASICNAMFELTKFDNVRLISGMNMNLILGILLNDHDKFVDEELKRLIIEAKQNIKLINPSEVDIANDEF